LWPKLSNPEVSGEKHTCFAGGRLTFLKLGLASAGFGGSVWNFLLKATNLPPDIVTWPNNLKEVTPIELTLCFGTTFEAATLSTKPPS